MIGHNQPPTFDDIVEQNLRAGLLLVQRDVLIRSLRDPRLFQRHRIVLAAIIEHMNSTTGMAYPGRAAIAKRTSYYDSNWEVQHYSESTVAKTISELMEYEYLEMSRRAPEGRKHFLAHYTLARPDQDELQREIQAYIDGIRVTGKKGRPALKDTANVTTGGNIGSDGNVTAWGNVGAGNVDNGGNVTRNALPMQNDGNVTTGIPANVTTGVPTVTSIGTVDRKNFLEPDFSQHDDLGFDGERVSFSHEDILAYEINYPELEFPKDLRIIEKATHWNTSQTASPAEYLKRVNNALSRKALEFRALQKQVAAVAASKEDRAKHDQCHFKNGRLHVAGEFAAELLQEFADGDADLFRRRLDKAAQYVPAKASGEALMVAVRGQLAHQMIHEAKGGKGGVATDAAARRERIRQHAIDAAEAFERNRGRS